MAAVRCARPAALTRGGGATYGSFLALPSLVWRWRGGAPTGRGFGRLGGFFGGRLELRGRFRQARLLGRRGGGEVALDIFLDDPAMHAAALHLRQIDAFLLGQLSRDGRHTARPFRLRFGVCFGGCRFLGGRGRRGLFGGGSRFLPGGRSRLINDPHHIAHLHICALLDADLGQHAVCVAPTSRSTLSVSSVSTAPGFDRPHGFQPLAMAAQRSTLPGLAPDLDRHRVSSSLECG